jgi:ribulose-5-phosphate 4-epimerase/fuculose-1-phosphate aldolase
MDSPHEINPAGFVIHSAIHAAREDAACVLHLHSRSGVAVSAQKEGVLPISQQSIFVLASLGYHDYEGVALRDDEKPRLVRDLGDKIFLMLRNHGLLTVGPTVADAFVAMYTFEATCMIQIRAQAGGELVRVDPRIIEGAMAARGAVTQGVGPGALAWPGLLRMLDRIDPSFRS